MKLNFDNGTLLIVIIFVALIGIVCGIAILQERVITKKVWFEVYQSGNKIDEVCLDYNCNIELKDTYYKKTSRRCDNE
jgi:hypothetical protein